MVAVAGPARKGQVGQDETEEEVGDRLGSPHRHIRDVRLYHHLSERGGTVLIQASSARSACLLTPRSGAVRAHPGVPRPPSGWELSKQCATAEEVVLVFRRGPGPFGGHLIPFQLIKMGRRGDG